MNDKRRSALRKELRVRRSGLSSDVQRQNATAVRDHLIATRILERVDRVACYWATRGELDLKPTIQYLQSKRIEVLLPVISDRDMRFAPLVNESNLAPNAYGILEPTDSKKSVLSPNDLILVPLVGYTQTGHRLGQGGGYYDRLLKGLSQRIAIGVAHSIQLTDEFNPQDHDEPLDAVVTENGLQTFGGNLTE